MAKTPRVSFPALTRPAAARARMYGVALLVGIVAGLAAAALEYGLHFGSEHVIGRVAHPGDVAVLRFDWWLLVLPSAGCLCVPADRPDRR